MTWIVGTPTMFGYAFGISDVRVTLADGREFDCLQKIYNVGQFVAAGFAGSVSIGFAMIEELASLLHLEDRSRAWELDVVAQWWPDDARRVFEAFPEQERRLQSDLILLSVHPQEYRGEHEWPRAFVYIFRSPDFAAQEVPVHVLGSIGSGSAYDKCKKVIDEFSANHERRFAYMKGEQGVPGGMATRLGHDLTELLIRNRVVGVSPHLLYSWVYRGRVIIRPNDHVRVGPWTMHEIGSGINREGENPIPTEMERLTLDEGAAPFQMPELASSVDELNRRLVEVGGCSAGSIA